MECSLLLEEAWSSAEKRAITKTKFKFDWQSVAIAASRRVVTIYSDDADVVKAAARAGIRVIWIDELLLPASAKQSKLDLLWRYEESSVITQHYTVIFWISVKRSLQRRTSGCVATSLGSRSRLSKVRLIDEITVFRCNSVRTLWYCT